MIEITDKDLFGETIKDALVAIDSNGKINTYERLRWFNAITKAVVNIEENGCFMELVDDHLLIWSQKSNEIYQANGACQCKAFENNFPCWHRAAAKLLKNYLEKLNKTDENSAFRSA